MVSIAWNMFMFFALFLCSGFSLIPPIALPKKGYAFLSCKNAGMTIAASGKEMFGNKNAQH